MEKEITPIIIQNILESMPLGLIVISPKGDFLVTNPTACKILGYPASLFKGRGWAEIFIETENNVAFNQVIVDVIREKKVNFRKEVPYLNPSGETLHLSMTTSLLHDDNDIIGLVVVIDDTTEIHRIRQREKKILEENTRLQEEQAEGLRKMALAVAHQIRNPLTAIGGFAWRMMKKTDGNGRNKAYLERILKGTTRLEDLVTAVRDYSDLSLDTAKKVPISFVFEMAKNGLTKKTGDRSKRVQWSTNIQAPEILVDPELFAQALEEIFLNAIESFNGEPGQIQVTARRHLHEVYLKISDNGGGIPEKDKPFIFDPFFTSKADGMGIGLCKAQRIIKEHKGEIQVSSSSGDGTVVNIHLPYQ